MYPISPDHTYEAQDSTTYLNPQNPVYVVSGAAGTENSPSDGKQKRRSRKEEAEKRTSVNFN